MSVAMDKLEFRLTNDMLFKMVFIKHPALLENLIALMLGIPVKSMTDFEITNDEMPLRLLGSNSAGWT
jgi:hypothetical protein